MINSTFRYQMELANKYGDFTKPEDILKFDPIIEPGEITRDK